jgi:FHA domain-containing protein
LAERVSALGFSLKILEGPDSGKVYSFDRVEITIGRTMDNDVVINDPGISRQHMSIRDKGGAYILKDLGSSNGTKLNGKKIGEEVLRPGDVIMMGTVQVRFEGPSGSSKAKKPAKRPARRQPSKRAPPRRQPTARQAGGKSRPGRKPAAGGRRQPQAAKSKGRPQKPMIRSSGVRQQNEEPKKVEEPAAAPEPTRPGKRGGARGKRRKGAKEKFSIKGLVTKMVTWFKGLDKKFQIALISGAAVLLVLMIVKAVQSGKEIVQVATDHSDQLFTAGMRDANKRMMTFGYGPVKMRCRSSANFKFKYANGRTILKYAVAAIDNRQEVAIQLNGMQIGYAPITMDKWSEKIHLVLPRKHLLGDEENRLSFVNTINYSNPESKQQWAVMVTAIDETPLPQPDSRAAEEAFGIAKERYKTRGVSPPNAYQAMQNFMRARDLLELLPEASRPEIYDESNEMIEKINEELNRKFKDLMFTAEKEQQFGHHRNAKELFRQIMITFPNTEDPRHIRARKKYERYK